MGAYVRNSCKCGQMQKLSRNSCFMSSALAVQVLGHFSDPNVVVESIRDPGETGRYGVGG